MTVRVTKVMREGEWRDPSSVKDDQITAIVDAAMGDDQDWAGAVDAALREAGVELGKVPDGSDPWLVARLADGREVYWSDYDEGSYVVIPEIGGSQ